MLTEPRPALVITLHHNTLSVQTIALIDSGSTCSLFDYQIGKELGIDVRAGELRHLASLGGSVIAYAHSIGLEIAEGFLLKSEVLFSENPVPRNLLGHHGFFDNVAVGLRGKVGQIYLQSEK